MTNEQLAALALAAIDDVDARVVLDDAMEETAWWDERCWAAMGWPWAASMWPGQEPFMSTAAWLTDKGPRAVAAVLLFGSWPTRWELAERCRPLHVNPWRIQQDDLLRAFEAALRCPEGWLQRITLLADDGLYKDNLNIRVERWPAGAYASRVATDRSISRHEIALSRDFIGLLVHEARNIDRAFQAHADKVPR